MGWAHYLHFTNESEAQNMQIPGPASPSQSVASVGPKPKVCPFHEHRQSLHAPVQTPPTG